MKKLFRNRAVKKYFRKLPQFLTHHWGRGFYSVGQVDRAIKETGCSSRHKEFAYAMYCHEPIFSSVSSGNYQSMREIVRSIIGIVHLLPDGNEFSSDNSYLAGGTGGGIDIGGGGSLGDAGGSD